MEPVSTIDIDVAAQSAPETPSRRVLANRANSKRSTGPRTAAGKARSSRNATQNCLTGQHLQFTNPGVSRRPYREALAALEPETASNSPQPEETKTTSELALFCKKLISTLARFPGQHPAIELLGLTTRNAQ